MLKKRLTSLKTIEKPLFFIRRMQKVGQKHRRTKFWPGPPVGGLWKESLLWGGGTPKVHLRLL